jgi:Amt family ammonium transporter
VEGTVTGLFYGGGWSQLLAEIVGTVACFVFVFVSFYVFFKIVGVLIGNRVPADVELEGLDLAEVGVLAYPEFYRPSPYSGTYGTVPEEAQPAKVAEGIALTAHESTA